MVLDQTYLGLFYLDGTLGNKMVLDQTDLAFVINGTQGLSPARMRPTIASQQVWLSQTTETLSSSVMDTATQGSSSIR